ncbi:precorrin-6A synthase (deacetylating) [Roseospirillum parvum]|uniref:Precorrin-6A synthase [deacetylating] n=1 Tax=Roseospirillum parvum TaxID=83401 RepID=A0A1G8EGW5_9PROT|nr:precorrin-6A synthase (deacetylating) [Roseospirillum parvum]SDH69076.1 precorrin-6A synthase [Roseospirillum parvum]
MKTVHLIGLGPGDPDDLTGRAIAAINQVDVFFLLDKAGPGKDELIQVRETILRRFATDKPYRLVHAPSPERDRAAADYLGAVEDWRQKKIDLIGRLIAEELEDGQTGGMLLWGDPALYDGTIQILHDLKAAGRDDFQFTVIPGITSLQALTARHRVAMNRVGGRITVTPGRALEKMAPEAVDNVFVMLDTRHAYKHFIGHDLMIYWGAYLGLPDETLIAGPLDQVAGQVEAEFQRLRAAKGWIMDCYLLRRRDG